MPASRNIRRRLRQAIPSPWKPALAENVYGGAPPSSGGGAERLARYVRSAADALAAQGDEELARSEVRFPDPARVATLLEV